MRVVRRNGLVEVRIHSWVFHEQGLHLPEKLGQIASDLTGFPHQKLLCPSSERLPCMRFPLYHALFIHYAEDLSHVYVMYGSAGSRRGIRVPTFDPGHYSATILSEPGNPLKGKGSLTFSNRQNKVGYYAGHGKSYLRENNFYGPDSPAILEIFLSPAWEQADFDIAGAITEHIERQERCITEIFENKGE